MLFASIDFILLLFPLILAIFLLARISRSLYVVLSSLIAASLALYCYSEPRFVPVMLISVALTFAMSRQLQQHRDGWLGRVIFAAGVVLNLLPFLYFKYASASELAPALAPSWISTTLPLGISFFTFQQIAYLLDVKRGTVSDPGFTKYCLFVLFFPHLVAGPIVRHNELLGQFTADVFFQGLLRYWAPAATLFSIALLKKVVVADRLAPYVDGALGDVVGGHAPTLIEAWAMLLGAAARIYYDYSAYADMALALALCFGVRLPISFYSPYQATSVADFWRRWNITLMRFFRDHIYIPLGGNRHGRPRQLFAIAATMVACGIWHGAGGNYVLWGALVAGCIGLELILRPFSGRIPLIMRTVLSRPIVLLAYVVPLAFFLFPTMQHATTSLAGAIGLNGFAMPGWAATSEHSTATTSMPNRFQMLLLAIAWLGIYVMPNTYQIFRNVLHSRWTESGLPFADEELHQTGPNWSPNIRWAAVTAACLALGVSSLGSDSAAAFYYFRF